MRWFARACPYLVFDRQTRLLPNLALHLPPIVYEGIPKKRMEKEKKREKRIKDLHFTKNGLLTGYLLETAFRFGSAAVQTREKCVWQRCRKQQSYLLQLLTS